MVQFTKQTPIEGSKKTSIHNIPIPDIDGDDSNSVYLSLQNNGVLDPCAYSKFLCHFKKLKTLRISKNSLQVVPNQIFELRDLKILDLSHNRIEKIDDAICLLENLVSFNLSNNLIFNLNKEIFKLPKLRFLFLCENKIEKVPDEILNQKSLLALDLRDNPLKKENSQSFLGFESLKSKLDDRVIVRDTELTREVMNRMLSRRMLRTMFIAIFTISGLLFYLLLYRCLKSTDSGK